MRQTIRAIIISCTMLSMVGAIGPATAVTSEVSEAVKSLEEVGVDPANLATFCRIIKELGAASEADDDVKSEAAGTEMLEFLSGLGPKFAQAWDLAEELDPETEDGKALEEAFGALEEKCGE